MNYKIGEITFEYQSSNHDLSILPISNYSRITSVTILSTIKEIGFCAFGYFRNLKSIIIPTSVTKICKNAFEYCDKLETLIIPPTVVEIENDAINPVVRLLILPQKFKPQCFTYDINRIFNGTQYKYEWNYYYQRRKIFYHGDQELINYLNITSDNLSQLRSYYPLLNRTDDKSLIENKILSQNRTLLQAYKNVSQKYPILFKEFEKEILRLDPNFKFD